MNPLLDSSSLIILFQMTAMLMICPFLSSAIAGSMRNRLVRRQKRRSARRREINEKLKRYHEIDMRKIL